MKITKEQLRTLVLEELSDMEEMDEGLWSNLKSSFKGGYRGGKQFGKNIKKAAWQGGGGKGGADVGASIQAGKSTARLEMAAKKFEKMGKDVYNDLKVLLKKTLGDEGADPEIKRDIAKLVSSLKGVVSTIKSIQGSLDTRIMAKGFKGEEGKGEEGKGDEDKGKGDEDKGKGDELDLGLTQPDEGEWDWKKDAEKAKGKEAARGAAEKKKSKPKKARQSYRDQFQGQGRPGKRDY